MFQLDVLLPPPQRIDTGSAMGFAASTSSIALYARFHGIGIIAPIRLYLYGPLFEKKNQKSYTEMDCPAAWDLGRAPLPHLEAQGEVDGEVPSPQKALRGGGAAEGRQLGSVPHVGALQRLQEPHRRRVVAQEGCGNTWREAACGAASERTSVGADASIKIAA